MARASRIERRLSADSRNAVCVLSEIGHVDSADDDILTAAALDEIRQLKHPPLVVQRTLEVMHLVLHARRHRHGIPRGGVKWESVLRTMMAEDLAERLQRFDIVELRQAPLLVNDLQEHYFSPQDKLEALSPDRVRRASATACTLFSWSARLVEAATTQSPEASIDYHWSDQATDVLDSLVNATGNNLRVEKANDDSIDAADASDDAKEEDEMEEAGLPPVTVGIWATCPGGHGLDVGCRGMSLTCHICGSSFEKGADTPVCRECGFFLCTHCRTGGWLSVNLVGFNDTREIEIVGFRWLRRGEDAPYPLSAEIAVQTSAPIACWGQQVVAMQEVALGKAGVELRPFFDWCTGGVVASIERAAKRFSSNRASGVFSVTDERARNAAVLVVFAGFPGVR